MSGDSRIFHDEAVIRQRAEDWVRRRDNGVSEREREELESWLAAAPSHARAFAEADTGRSVLDWPLEAGATAAVMAGLQARARHRRARQQLWSSVGVAALVALVFGVWLRPTRPSASPDSVSAMLEVLQPSTQTLPDGSVVELKENAQITPDFSGHERRVRLTRGTAHFAVKKDSRPFVVSAGPIAVRAVGTAFSVEVEDRGVTVLVTEGRVAVEPTTASEATIPEAPLASIDAGSGVIVPAGQRTVQAIASPDLQDQLGWRIPRLEFSGMALGEVARTLNRYNRVQLVIADSALEQLRVSGALRADKVNALVAMLETDFPVNAERRSNDTIVLRERR